MGALEILDPGLGIMFPITAEDSTRGQITGHRTIGLIKIQGLILCICFV